MNLKKLSFNSTIINYGLIITFFILYLCVGFVSTLHSITFFHLANSMGLSILLGLTYEIGQASVLFGILTTKNKDRFLPWALMFLLTALQVTANVFASFKWIAESGSNDWVYWQKAILIGVTAANPEMYQIIISWIAGALLPVVALGMTALVAENMKMMNEESLAPEKEKELKVEKAIAIAIPEDSDEIDLYKVSEGMNKFNEINKKPIPQKLKFNVSSEYTVPQLTLDLQPNRDGVGQVDWPGTLPKSIPPLSETGTLETQSGISSGESTATNIEYPTVLETSKKAQELLQKEEVQVPQKAKRFVNPLLRKSKIEKLKVKDLYKPSKGDEAIALIEKMDKAKAKGTIIQNKKDAQKTPESLLTPPDTPTPYLQNGVEVIDAKAIQKED